MPTYRSYDRGLLVRCAGVFATVLIVTIGCGAQESDNLRAEARASAAAAAKSNRAAATVFLDRAQSAEARLAAVKNVPSILDRGDTVSALERVRDEEEPVAIRVRAIELAGHALGRDDEQLTEVLALLRNPDTPSPLRAAVAEALHLLLIGGSAPATRHEDIIATLRAVMKDADAAVRTIALSTLAAEGDDAAQQVLATDLRDPSSQLIPPEQAVALLALHPDGDTAPALREVLANPPNAQAQIEAAQALGADVQSHDDLQQVIGNTEASDELRFAAVGALNANAPEKIAAAALPLLNDEGAGDDVRIYAIKAVQALQEANGGLESVQSPAEKAFDAAVNKLRTKAKSAAVRDAAKAYVTKK